MPTGEWCALHRWARTTHDPVRAHLLTQLLHVVKSGLVCAR